MAQADITYVFESEAGRALHELWLRDRGAATHLTFDELVALVLPALPSPAERAAAFSKLLTEEERPRADALLYTIDRLREAMVLTGEDIAFAFNELPQTPKNRELRSVLARYADSELARDRTFHIWSLVEKLKDREVTFSGSGRVVFVRDRGPSSILFTEVARAFSGARGVVEATLVDPWEVAPSDAQSARRGLTLYGDVAPSLRALGDAVARLVARRTSPEEIVIPFAGEAKALQWLRHYLHHHEIPYRVCLPEAPVVEQDAAATLPKLLSALRRDTTRALKERLKLSATLLEAGVSRRARDTWETFFEKLVSRGKLEAGDPAYLTGLLVPAPDRPRPAEAGGALIVPFQPLPTPPGTASLAYVDATVLRPPATPLLFKEGEIELLHGRGFALPRLSAYRERLMASFAAYTGRASRRRLLFSALPPGSFPQAGRSGHVARRARARAGTVPFDPSRRFAGEWGESYLAGPVTSALSATQLETYARCPALYFFSQRLNLRPRELADDKYPLIFGQATHLALESYFKELAKRAARPDPDTMIGELADAFRAAVRQVSPGLDETHPLFIILRENFARISRFVPALEEKLATVAGQLVPASFEEEFRIDLGDVTLKGKIDRVDRRADGALLVLDYKTGSVDFTPDHINQGTHFQALLYLVAAEKIFRAPCVGIVFYDLKKGEARRGVFIEELVQKEAKKAVTRGHVLPAAAYEALRDQGMARLREIAQKLAAGSFAPAASPEACIVCDYATLCRKRVGYV